MANMIVPREAEINWLNVIIAAALNTDTMHLWVSASYTVSATTTLADLVAIEASFTGYSPVSLGTWTVPSIDGSGAASSTTYNGIFTNNGVTATTVYGMYVTDYTDSFLHGAEQYTSPISIPASLSFQDVLTFTVLSRY